MGNGGSAPSPFIAGGGQPPASTIAGNDGFSACTRDSSSRAVAEAAWGSGDAHVLSITTRQSRPQAIGARGTPHLALGFASKPSLSAPWARGATIGILGMGVPRLACLRPRAWLIQRPGMTHLHQQTLKTLARGLASQGGRHKDL